MLKKVAESAITTSSVRSGILTGTMFDTTLKFIASDGTDIFENSSSWGNYNNKYGYTINGYYMAGINATQAYSYGEYTKSVNGNLLLTTGKFAEAISEGLKKNLYDIAGNLWEYASERAVSNTDYISIRGGSLYDNGNKIETISSGRVVAHRSLGHLETEAGTCYGFRLALYIL